jgi:hypothetical protein
MGLLSAALSPAQTDVMAAVEAISWWRVAAAFFVAYSLVPIAAAVTMAKPTIVWAGIRQGPTSTLLHFSAQPEPFLTQNTS